MARYRDAYPYPTDGERARDIQLSRLPDDKLWEAELAEALEVDDNPTQPAIIKHFHTLCGHDCLSGACQTVDGLCLNCEFRLQDGYRESSRGMNRHE